MSLTNDIKDAINKNSAENASNTPDFMLAEFLMGCLMAFNRTIMLRDGWNKWKPEHGIRLNAAEVQSGFSRVAFAEKLISKLPVGDGGRDTWLMNYGTGKYSQRLRLRDDRHIQWDEATQSAQVIPRAATAAMVKGGEETFVIISADTDESIHSFANRMIITANEKKGTVIGLFNQHTLRATPSSSRDDVIRPWTLERKLFLPRAGGVD